jgi:hypothetical protein
VTDDDGATDDATVTLTVNGAQNCAPPNTAPTAYDGSASGDEDTAINGAAAGSDPENDVLTYSLVSNVSYGALNFNNDGTFSYTPNANFNGQDSFTFKANDGEFDSNTATFTLTVNPVNDPPTLGDPTANPNPVDLTCDQAVALVNLSVTAEDIDGDALSFEWTWADTVQATDQNPQVELSATVEITVTVSDGNGGTASKKFTVTVNPAQGCEPEQEEEEATE